MLLFALGEGAIVAAASPLAPIVLPLISPGLQGMPPAGRMGQSKGPRPYKHPTTTMPATPLDLSEINDLAAYIRSLK
jgi:hypothetical protein